MIKLHTIRRGREFLHQYPCVYARDARDLDYGQTYRSYRHERTTSEESIPRTKFDIRIASTQDAIRHVRLLDSAA